MAYRDFAMHSVKKTFALQEHPVDLFPHAVRLNRVDGYRKPLR